MNLGTLAIIGIAFYLVQQNGGLSAVLANITTPAPGGPSTNNQPTQGIAVGEPNPSTTTPTGGTTALVPIPTGTVYTLPPVADTKDGGSVRQVRTPVLVADPPPPPVYTHDPVIDPPPPVYYQEPIYAPPPVQYYEPVYTPPPVQYYEPVYTPPPPPVYQEPVYTPPVQYHEPVKTEPTPTYYEPVKTEPTPTYYEPVKTEPTPTYYEPVYTPPIYHQDEPDSKSKAGRSVRQVRPPVLVVDPPPTVDPLWEGFDPPPSAKDFATNKVEEDPYDFGPEPENGTPEWFDWWLKRAARGIY